MSVTLLVRHPSTGSLLVNFDQSVFQLLDEAVHLQRMGLDIPLLAMRLIERRKTIITNYNNVKVCVCIHTHVHTCPVCMYVCIYAPTYACSWCILTRCTVRLAPLCMLSVQLVLKEYEETRASIPSVFEPLMVPHLQTVNVVVEQGLTAITWGSLNISTFVDSVRRALKQLQLVISRASEILEHRICRTLQSMSEVSLCKLPDGEQWTIHTLVSRTEVGACMGNE